MLFENGTNRPSQYISMYEFKDLFIFDVYNRTFVLHALFSPIELTTYMHKTMRQQFHSFEIQSYESINLK